MTVIDMDSAEVAGKPIVRERSGRAIANSRNVAEFFGKHHGHVMRTIRSLLAAEPALGRSSFGLAEYIDDQGKHCPTYDMDRVGFALLAMDFTSPKALKFKLAYIDAFNRMEAELAASGDPTPLRDHREFPDWPLEELRTKKATADLYRMVYGPLSAQWIMPQLGFPAPPRQIVELGRQLGLALEGLAPHPMSGSAHSI
jgi:Rha family phage regulatory protein